LHHYRTQDPPFSLKEGIMTNPLASQAFGTLGYSTQVSDLLQYPICWWYMSGVTVFTRATALFSMLLPSTSLSSGRGGGDEGKRVDGRWGKVRRGEEARWLKGVKELNGDWAVFDARHESLDEEFERTRGGRRRRRGREIGRNADRRGGKDGGGGWCSIIGSIFHKGYAQGWGLPEEERKV
jgi:hypothetical protein